VRLRRHCPTVVPPTVMSVEKSISMGNGLEPVVGYPFVSQ
jgi:hypothetical protein